jgi:hypothetical protein
MARIVIEPTRKSNCEKFTLLIFEVLELCQYLFYSIYGILLLINKYDELNECKRSVPLIVIIIFLHLDGLFGKLNTQKTPNRISGIIGSLILIIYTIVLLSGNQQCLSNCGAFGYMLSFCILITLVWGIKLFEFIQQKEDNPSGVEPIQV